MGDYFQTIVDRETTLEEAEALASRIRLWLIDEAIIEATMKDCVLGGNGIGYPPGARFAIAIDDQSYDIRHLWTNGLDIIVGKTVFDSGQGRAGVSCPLCKNLSEPRVWPDAITEWYEGAGPGILRCSCGYAAPITDWSFDPPWGFGNLGFTFWNWPPFKQSFIADIAQRLNHRTVYVYGKL